MINTTYVRFHRLADDLKAAVTSPEAIEQIEKLEQKYGVALADILIRLMVKEITLADLPSEITKESKLEQQQTDALLQDLQTTLLRQVIPYLSQSAVRQEPVLIRPPAPPQVLAQTQRVGPAAQPRPLSSPLPTSALVQPARPRPPAPIQPLTPVQPRPPRVPIERPLPPQTPQRAPAATLRHRPEARASYYVDPEDEADISRHRDRLRELAGPSPTAELRPAIDALMTRAGVRIPPDQAARLSSLLLSRLRDVRTTEEFSTILTRPWHDGGMGMEAQTAATLASMTDDEAAKLHDAQLARHLATPAAVSPQPALPQVRPAVPVPAVPPVSPSPGPPRIPRPVQPSPSPVPSQSVRRPATPLQPRSAVRPVVERTGASETNQRLIHDIKRPVRPVSPAEELASLTADDFRQMARTFAEAAGKVLERINLLAEESYSKRSEGIAAWRQSDLYKVYLGIGSESMASAQPIDVVIERRKAAGQPYLTTDEFAVLADLNRQLTA